MDNLPAWIDPEALDEFVSMRTRIKKPLTPRAMTRLIHRLQAIKDAGHCPNASLIQSADHYWQDCYVPKEMPIERARGVETNKWLAEYEQAKKNATPPPAALLKMVGRG